MQAAALMQQGEVVELDDAVAVTAAKIGHEMKLPRADTVIVSTARAHRATIWTQNADLKNVDGVEFVAERQSL